MTVKEKPSIRTELQCQCGGVAKYIRGTVGHSIKGGRILIHNVPHYRCDFCGSVYYGEEVDVLPILRYAYKTGQNEIEWEDKLWS